MNIARVLLAAALLAGCASATAIPDDQREQLGKELTSKSRFLKVSMYKGPFWHDETKTLLSDVDPTTLQYLTDTDGKVIPSGAATGIVPLGRHVKITQVELPTAMVVAGRMVYSPRYNPWVYLEVEGEDHGKPEVLVLRPGIKSHDEFVAVLERYLSVDDPTPALANYSDPVRTAIRGKQVVKEMDAAAVEMAWGYPEHKHIDVKDGHRSETWTYGAGERQVELSDGKVTDSKQNATSTAAP